jgi:hypothetical protein
VLDSIADYRQRLALILGAATEPPRSRSLYAALAEAAADPIVRRALNRVATSRIDYLEVCYRQLGFTASAAKAQAVFAYASYRGLLQLAHEAPASLPSAWTEYSALIRRTFVPPPTRARRAGRTPNA